MVKVVLSKYLALYNIPKFLEILLSMQFMWFRHVIFSSRRTPKNFIVVSLLIFVLFIFNSGRRNGTLSAWQRMEKAVFCLGDIYGSFICQNLTKPKCNSNKDSIHKVCKTSTLTDEKILDFLIQEVPLKNPEMFLTLENINHETAFLISSHLVSLWDQLATRSQCRVYSKQLTFHFNAYKNA